MKNKLGIKIHQHVELIGLHASAHRHNRIKGVVVGFHKSGRAFVVTEAGHRWMLPLHRLNVI